MSLFKDSSERTLYHLTLRTEIIINKTDIETDRQNVS